MTNQTNGTGKNYIWRYISFAKFADMAIHNRLFFSRLKFLQDEYEGKIGKNSEKNIKDFAKFLKLRQPHQDESQLINALTQAEIFSNSEIESMIYANCWHINSIESAIMWASYCQSNESVCIKADLEKIQHCLPTFTFYSPLQYVDIDEEDKVYSMQRFLKKQKEFSDEAELRLFTRFLHGREDQNAKIIPTGMYVNIFSFDFVEEIILHPTANPWFEQLEQFPLRFGHTQRVRGSSSTLVG